MKTIKVERLSWRDVPALVDFHRGLERQNGVNFAGSMDALDAIHPSRHKGWAVQLVLEIAEGDEVAA
jgi:hypothetical protein